MDLNSYESYNGLWYCVSANRGKPQEWRGTIDICRKRGDGTIEVIRRHKDIQGQFASESEAREAAKSYARAVIDGTIPGLDV